MERIKLVLKVERVSPTALAHGLLEVRAQPGSDVGGHRNAPDPAHGIEAERHVVIARQLDEFLTAGETLGADPGKVPGGVLDCDDTRMFCDLGKGFDGYVRHGARRYVIDNDQEWRCLGNGFEMRRKAGLARLVVIRDDYQRGIGTDIGGRANTLDRGCGGIGAAASDYGHPALRDLDSARDDLAVLVGGQGRGLSGRSARNQRVRAFGDLPLDEFGKCVLSDTAA